MSFVLILYFDWLLGPHKGQNFEEKKTFKNLLLRNCQVDESCIVNVEWESRAISLTIYDDLHKTYLWGICTTLNLFVALTAASESIYDVINMAAT